MYSVQFVTPVDDAEFLTDALVAFIRAAVAAGKSWHAQVFFAMFFCTQNKWDMFSDC